MKYLKQYNTLWWTQMALITGGLATLFISFANSSENEGVPTGAKIGLGIAVSSWIPHLMRPEKIKKALKVYNQ